MWFVYVDFAEFDPSRRFSGYFREVVAGMQQGVSKEDWRRVAACPFVGKELHVAPRL